MFKFPSYSWPVLDWEIRKTKVKRPKRDGKLDNNHTIQACGDVLSKRC